MTDKIGISATGNTIEVGVSKSYLSRQNKDMHRFRAMVRSTSSRESDALCVPNFSQWRYAIKSWPIHCERVCLASHGWFSSEHSLMDSIFFFFFYFSALRVISFDDRNRVLFIIVTVCPMSKVFKTSLLYYYFFPFWTLFVLIFNARCTRYLFGRSFCETIC